MVARRQYVCVAHTLMLLNPLSSTVTLQQPGVSMQDPDLKHNPRKLSPVRSNTAGHSYLTCTALRGSGMQQLQTAQKHYLTA